MSSQHPFRFGVISEQMSSASNWLDQVRAIEDRGYSTLLLRDHFIKEPFGDQFAPLTALMAAANATKSLHVGTLVIDNDYRHPAVLAKEAATLDLFSGGRFELGLGAGWLKEEYRQTGIEFASPGVRVSRLEESLHIIKGLFSDNPVTFNGTHYNIADLQGFPLPEQRSGPPILVAAGGKRMLTLAAREADIINFQTFVLTNGVVEDDPQVRSAATLAQQIELVRQAAGERFPHLELSLILRTHITQDRGQGAAEIARLKGWSGIDPEQILAMPSIFIGSIDQIIEEMYTRREQYGISYYMTTDKNMEVLAPIVAKLAGK